MNITKSYRLPRRDEIIIHRMRKHAKLIHGHLLKKTVHLNVVRPKLNSQLTTYYTALSNANAIRINHFTVTNLLD